ncbi:hypothetical protein K8Q94_02230 [Candidatus Nomurabacteria bacterium]|nr:hypothetical protein [Candidatus Nomurabacteria bacterium]
MKKSLPLEGVVIIDNSFLLPPLENEFKVSRDLEAFFENTVKKDRGFRELLEIFGNITSAPNVEVIEGNFSKSLKETSRDLFFKKLSFEESDRRLNFISACRVFKKFILDSEVSISENVVFFIPLFEKFQGCDVDLILLKEKGQKDFRIFHRKINGSEVVVDKDTIIIL